MTDSAIPAVTAPASDTPTVHPALTVIARGLGEVRLLLDVGRDTDARVVLDEAHRRTLELVRVTRLDAMFR